MWRYKLVRIGFPGREPLQIQSCEARLNELGGDGWEAVGVVQQADSWYVLFKMPHEVGTY